MCICICGYVFMCAYKCVYIYIYIYICACERVCMYMYVGMYQILPYSNIRYRSLQGGKI